MIMNKEPVPVPVPGPGPCVVDCDRAADRACAWCADDDDDDDCGGGMKGICCGRMVPGGWLIGLPNRLTAGRGGCPPNPDGDT